MPTTAASPLGALAFFRHPKGVYVLAFVELWERFSFYGFLGLFVLFVSAPLQSGGLGWTNASAIVLFGTYSAIAFALPIPGGWIADRVLGPRRAVVAGALNILAGHLLLAAVPLLMNSTNALGVSLRTILAEAGLRGGVWFSAGEFAAALAGTSCNVSCAGTLHPLALGSSLAFFGGLGLIAIGSGFLKPTVASIVGYQYGPDDPRQTLGFAFFWVGINLGALLGNLIAGTLGEKVAWHYGLGAPAVGMFAALLVYLAQASSIRFVPHLSAVGTSTATAQRTGWKAALTLGVAALACTVFWLGFLQKGGLLAVFARDVVDRQIGDFSVPVTWILALNPLVVLLGAPLLTARFAQRSARFGDDIFARNFAIALALAALAYGSLYLATSGTAGPQVGIGWLVFWYVLVSLGEVALWPTAFALVARCSPPGWNATLLGLWYGMYAVCSFSAAAMGARYAGEQPVELFLLLCGASTLAAVTLYMFWPTSGPGTGQPGRVTSPGSTY